MYVPLSQYPVETVPVNGPMGGIIATMRTGGQWVYTGGPIIYMGIRICTGGPMGSTGGPMGI